MARLRTTILHWGNKYDGPNTYKDGRRGALDDAFWDEDELVDYRRKGEKKTNPHFKGCPGNNGNAHVYVWEKHRSRSWYSGNIFEYEVLLCCGCLKQKGNRGWRRIN